PPGGAAQLGDKNWIYRCQSCRLKLSVAPDGPGKFFWRKEALTPGETGILRLNTRLRTLELSSQKRRAHVRSALKRKRALPCLERWISLLALSQRALHLW